jgi:uncharacterized protein YkwD
MKATWAVRAGEATRGRVQQRVAPSGECDLLAAMFRPAVMLVAIACAWLHLPALAAGGERAPDVEDMAEGTLAEHGLLPKDFARALLAETNRARRAHGRRALRAKPELEAAADDQAAFMALRMHTQHGSFLPGQATVAERVGRHGLDGIAVAENVASAALGESLRGHSAETIAAMLVAQWMDSPNHRANLLDRRHTHFGGSVRITRMIGREWAAYGTQVFLVARPPFGHVSS